MALEEPGDGADAQTPGSGGRRGQRPELAHPGACEIAFDLEKLRKVALELLSGTVDKTRAIRGQVPGDARPFARFDDIRRHGIEAPEGVGIGAQGVAEHAGVAAVVLGAGRREPIAKAVELLGIDGMNREAAFHQRFDDGTVRDLDGEPRDIQLGASAPAVATIQSAIAARPAPP